MSQSIKYQVSSIKYQVSSIKYQVSSLICLLILIIFFISCDNMSLVSPESNTYEPKTSVAKTFSTYKSLQETAFKKIMKEVQDCYNELVKKYPDSPPLYQGKKGDIVRISPSLTINKKEITLEELSSILPDPEQKSYTEEDLQRIKEMEKRIAEIKREFAMAIESIKPDVSRLSELGYVGVSEDNNVITIAGLSIDIRDIQGAMVAELLNAELNGEKEEEIVKDLKSMNLLLEEKIEKRSSILLDKRKSHFKRETYCLFRWPGGKIRYKFGHIDPIYRQAVEQAMREWENATGCIRFENAVDNSYWENQWRGIRWNGVLNIYETDLDRPGSCNIGTSISWDDGALGSYCKLRLDTNDPATGGRLYNNIEGNPVSGYDYLMRVCRHELGHAIGLTHEHQRWDRGNFVRLEGTGSPNDSQIISYAQNRRADTYQFIVDWRWEKIARWKIWYIAGWKWVGGAWWEGGRWEPDWKYYYYDVYGWVAYGRWVPLWIQDTYTPTPYDVRSVMHYFSNGTYDFRLIRDYQGLRAGEIIRLWHVLNITEFDAQGVRELYNGWYWWHN